MIESARSVSFGALLVVVLAVLALHPASAQALQDLSSPPGNRLEALRGNLKGSHSIRINVQWRLVFRWADGKAHDVRIMDYHG